MRKTKACIRLSSSDRSTLQGWVSGRNTPQKVVWRAEIVLLSAAPRRVMAIALEFQLGADIPSTAVAPSWDAIGKLSAIAVIRTALNYFLIREMREEHSGAATP